MQKSKSLSFSSDSQAFPRVHKKLEICLVMRVFWWNFWNSIIYTNPSVAMVISSHQILEHISSFLDQFYQRTSRLGVVGILFNMLHHENDFLAHWSALYSCASVIEQIDLVLCDGLWDSILEDLSGCGIFQGEDSLYHFVAVVKLRFCEVVFVPEINERVTSC